jgi:hypothetical protein
MMVEADDNYDRSPVKDKTDANEPIKIKAKRKLIGGISLNPKKRYSRSHFILTFILFINSLFVT